MTALRAFVPAAPRICSGCLRCMPRNRSRSRRSRPMTMMMSRHRLPSRHLTVTVLILIWWQWRQRQTWWVGLYVYVWVAGGEAGGSRLQLGRSLPSSSWCVKCGEHVSCFKQATHSQWLKGNMATKRQSETWRVELAWGRGGGQTLSTGRSRPAVVLVGGVETGDLSPLRDSWVKL
jgi:hypothetical protein